jgi:putative aldouronate transport system permease protein
MIDKTNFKKIPEVHPLLKDLKINFELYLMIIPVVVYFIVFHYLPMYGIIIAFKNFNGIEGILGSPWVGFEHFERFFRSYNFWALLKNTLGISLYSQIVNFPAPIILAIMLNEIKHSRFKKTVQMVTYAPHFISTVVMVGMLLTFLSPTGIINQLVRMFGFETVAFIAKAEYFKTIYVVSGLWQGLGWGTIIYMAALSNIDSETQEAAMMDGASKIKRIIFIDFPSILPTAVIMLILNMGSIMSVGFEKVFLMQNPLNMITSDVISTYVYRMGILGGEFSFSAAVGLFNAIINIILLLIVNRIAKKTSETGLW